MATVSESGESPSKPEQGGTSALPAGAVSRVARRAGGTGATTARRARKGALRAAVVGEGRTMDHSAQGEENVAASAQCDPAAAGAETSPSAAQAEQEPLAQRAAPVAGHGALPFAACAASIVLLRGLPNSICTSSLIGVMLEQAGLQGAVSSWRLWQGETCGEAMLVLAHPQWAEHCMRHFHGCQWDASGASVTAQLADPEDVACAFNIPEDVVDAVREAAIAEHVDRVLATLLAPSELEPLERSSSSKTHQTGSNDACDSGVALDDAAWEVAPVALTPRGATPCAQPWSVELEEERKVENVSEIVVNERLGRSDGAVTEASTDAGISEAGESHASEEAI